MALGEKYRADWRGVDNINQVVTNAGNIGLSAPTLTATEGSFTLAFTTLDTGRNINFGTIKNAFNTQTVKVSFKMSGAIDSTIDFTASTANQITTITNNSDGEYQFTCTLNSGYDHPEFAIISRDGSNGIITFSQVKIQGDLYRVALWNEGYVGSITEIETKQVAPVIIDRRGDKNVQIERGILGSQLTFNFFIDDTDVSTYDAIFESNYKDWQVQYEINETVDWYGWLLPENFSRVFISDSSYYAYSLTATDGLAQLKQIEFRNFSTGDFYEDRVSLITIIKRCLEHIEIDLDFRIHVNHWVSNDSLMVAADPLFEDVDSRSDRFIKDDDGRTVNIDCYTMIERILAPFNAYLLQAENYYWIVNAQERDSYYHPATWALTFSTRVAQNLTVDINNFKFRRNPELQKIRPIEAILLTFRDRNVEDSLLTNGDFSSGTTNWTNNGYTAFNVVSGEGKITYATTDGAAYLAYADLSVTSTSVDDKIFIKFDAIVDSITFDPGQDDRLPYIICKIYDGSNVLIGQTSLRYLSEDEWSTVTAEIAATAGVTTLRLRFYVSSHPTSDITTSVIALDNVISYVLYNAAGDVTFDRFYKITNNDSVFVDKIKTELGFGDSDGDTDIGGFQVSGTRSETWNRYGKTDNEKIQLLYAQNLIENFQEYKNYTRATIFDPDYLIKPYSILEYESKYYQIITSREIYENGVQRQIEVEMIEMLNAAVTTSVVQETLTTIDGQ